MRTTRVRSTRQPLANVAVVVGVNAAVVMVIVAAPSKAPLVLGVVLALMAGVYLCRKLVERPQYGILLLAALLPFDGLLTITPLPDFANGWKEALVVLTLGATFVAPRRERGALGRAIPGWAPLVLAFVAIGVASALVRLDHQGLEGVKVTFFYILIAVAIWRCPLKAVDRDNLVSILMATGLVTASFGLLQQVLGDVRLAGWGWNYNTNIRFAGGFLRSFSTFNDNFPFALFLMLVVLIGLPCALTDTRRLRNQLFLLSIPMLLGALALTITRAAWVGLVVGLLYLGAVRFRSMLAVLMRVGIVAVLLLVLFSGFAASFLSERSAGERFAIWEDNAELVIAHPLGMGIGATGSAAAKIADIEDAGHDALQPDNYYFKTILELGVIGLWIFVILLVSVFTFAHRAARARAPLDAAFAQGVAAMVLAAAVVSTSATYFEVFPLDAYFWMFLAVVATCPNIESR
jgi:putative inorganic carbon (HCO3(-)) transporter